MNKKKLKKAKAELAKEKAICKKHRKMCKKHTKKLAKHQRSQEHLERIINAAKYDPNASDEPRILSRGGEQSVFSVPNGTGSFLETAFKNRAHLVANVPEPADRYTDAEIVERCLDRLDIVNDRHEFLEDLWNNLCEGDILFDITDHERETIDFRCVKNTLHGDTRELLINVPQLGKLMDDDASSIEVGLEIKYGNNTIRPSVNIDITDVRYPSVILRNMRHCVASTVYDSIMKSIDPKYEASKTIIDNVPPKYEYTLLGSLETFAINTAILVSGLFFLNAIMHHAGVSVEYWKLFEDNFLCTPIYSGNDMSVRIDSMAVFMDDTNAANDGFIIPIDNGHLLEMTESGKYEFMFRLKEEDESDKEADDSTVIPVSYDYGIGGEPGPTKMSI